MKSLKDLNYELNNVQNLINSINVIKERLLKERRGILKQINKELSHQSVKEQDDDYVPF